MTVAQPSDRRSDPSVGLILAVLGRASMRQMTDALRPSGLKPRHLALLTELRERPSTQHALGEAIGVDPTKLVGLLNDLEACALIVRRRDPGDRRRHIVEISPCGRERLSEIERLVAATEERMLAALDAGQRATLHALLAQVAATGGLKASCSGVAAEDDAEP